MKVVECLLNKELSMLKRAVEHARMRMRNAPEGFLRIAVKGSDVEYYHKSKESACANGRYLKKSEIKIAKDIAQRDYDAQIIKRGEERIKAITSFLQKYERTGLEEIFTKTNKLRRNLIVPEIVSDEEYIKAWLAVEYVGKAFLEDAPEIYTDRGERVRSKSEKIIADKLYALGVPYRYECPLILSGDVRIYPDFTILKMPEREEVYLEHFGMMDDKEYVDNMLYKLNTYEKNGIFLGIHLFMTHETGREPLNTRVLDRFVRALWCHEL